MRRKIPELLDPPPKRKAPRAELPVIAALPEKTEPAPSLITEVRRAPPERKRRGKSLADIAAEVKRAALEKEQAEDRAMVEVQASKPRLDETKAKEMLQLSDADIAMLDRIASGHSPKNAHAVLKAIQLKLEYSISKPKQVIDKTEQVTVVIQSLGDEPTVKVVGDEPAHEQPKPEDLM